MKKVKSYRGTGFPPICGTLSALSWNINNDVSHDRQPLIRLMAQMWNINNDVCHDRQPLIRVIAQMWNSCSTLGVQNLANALSWNHVNSLNRRIKKNTTFL